MSVSAVGAGAQGQVAAIQALAKPAQLPEAQKVETAKADSVEISGQAKQLSQSLLSE